MLLPWPKCELMWDILVEFSGSPVSNNEKRLRLKYLDITGYIQI